MQYTKIQLQSFLDSGRFLNVLFYLIRAWWPFCSKVQNHLNKLMTFPRQKAPREIKREIGQAVSEKTFKDNAFLGMYTAQR